MRALRWVAIALVGVAAATLLWLLGLTLYYRPLAGPEMPFLQLYGFIAGEAWGRIYCGVTGCPVELPEGMTSRVWDERLLRSTPVALDVDPEGRVYVTEADRNQGGVADNRQHMFWLLDDLASRTVEDRRAYYEKWLAAGKFPERDWFTRRSDKVLRLADTDGDGVADERKDLIEFHDMVDGLASGVLWLDGELWITSIPRLLRLRDADGDGLPEQREDLATGFGVKSSLIGHDLHGLALGPDGKIYFSMGDRGYFVKTREGKTLEPPLDPGRGAVFRIDRDGSNLEVFATGLRNPQELAFDDYGNLFTGENNSDSVDEARVAYLVQGSDAGWAMPYQSMTDPAYPRAMWVAERLWETQHEGQPAWVVPPIGYLGRGPAGFAHYPGTGLPDSYRGRFFLADYRYTPARSAIWSFGVEPAGAGFRVVDPQPFVRQVVATDLAFSFDGRLLVSHYEDLTKQLRILVMESPTARADPRVAEVARLAREGMGARSGEELAALLAHADQRIRLRAQLELARRKETPRLQSLARDASAPELARIHALWALGQIGAESLAGLEQEDVAGALPPELRAQLARVAGDAGARAFAPLLLKELGDESPRVRFFAAQSLGALGAREAVAPLMALLRENADRDVFLRHAACWALHRIGDADAVLGFAADRSRSVRLGVLLFLRWAKDARVAEFLHDEDRGLVAEAARAIHDVPIRAANAALAGLAGALAPPAADDRETGFALHRRVLAANLAEGREQDALALAAYAADPRQGLALRSLALEALAQFAKPEPREPVNGFYRPLPERPRELVFPALDRYGRALVEGELGERALAIATAYGRIPLDDAELLARAQDAQAAPEARAASLAALSARAEQGAREAALAAARAALASDAPALRAEGRDVLASLAAQEGVGALLALAPGAPLLERQRGWAALAKAQDPRAEAAISQALDRLASGNLESAVQLDVMEAARTRGGALRAKLAAWEAEQPADDLLARYAFALDGGDAARGARAFASETAECVRCHGSEGHGGGAGPSLAGVSERHNPRGLLESVLLPQAEIAPGFASVSVTLRDGAVVSGTLVEADASEVVVDVGAASPRQISVAQIAERSEPASAMPPTALGLTPRELRDLIAYLRTL